MNEERGAKFEILLEKTIDLTILTPLSSRETPFSKFPSRIILWMLR